MHSIVVRYAEIGIKGKNRRHFENRLAENIRIHLKSLGENTVTKRLGRLEIHSNGDLEKLIETLRKIPGIANFSPVVFVPLNQEALLSACREMVSEKIEAYTERPVTFRVSAKRANKEFPIDSMELESRVGASLLKAFPILKVKLKDPLLDVGMEIWENKGVVFTEKIKGTGGLPVNDQERAIALISGGIDSPVACWMIMKRGCRVIFLYFHSFPLIGDLTKEKVIDLVKWLSAYQPASRLYVAPFAEIQKNIRKQTPEKFRTILYRRFMNLIANEIAKKENAQAIVTGDALSQVASQTLSNLVSTTENAGYPVLRPLIGMDKNEITHLSRSIGTYPISIQDFPDCCTVFQPSNPATRTFLPQLFQAEANIEDAGGLVAAAVNGCEIYDFSSMDTPLWRTETMASPSFV